MCSKATSEILSTLTLILPKLKHDSLALGPIIALANSQQNSARNHVHHTGPNLLLLFFAQFVHSILFSEKCHFCSYIKQLWEKAKSNQKVRFFWYALKSFESICSQIFMTSLLAIDANLR